MALPVPCEVVAKVPTLFVQLSSREEGFFLGGTMVSIPFLAPVSTGQALE